MDRKTQASSGEAGFDQAKGGTARAAGGRSKTLIPWRLRPGKGGLGCLDSRGDVAIPPRFDYVGGFCDGAAAVGLGGRYGIIGVDGKFLLPLTEKFEQIYELGEGLWSCQKRRRIGAIDAGGNVMFPPTFHVIRSFVGGVANAATGPNSWGFIDASGTPLVEFCYDETGAFSEGLAGFELGGAKGYLDRQMRIKIGPSRCRRFGGEFKGGVALFREGGLAGLINAEGEVVTEFRFKQVLSLNDGLIWVKLGRLWRVVRTDGEFAFEAGFLAGRYDYGGRLGRLEVEPSPFYHGLARVGVQRQGEFRFGFVDTTGRFAIPPIFPNAGDFFKGGLARVFFEKPKRGDCHLASLINTRGEVLYGPRKGDVVA
jgi:hypothetical protein